MDIIQGEGVPVLHRGERAQAYAVDEEEAHPALQFRGLPPLGGEAEVVIADHLVVKGGMKAEVAVEPRGLGMIGMI